MSIFSHTHALVNVCNELSNSSEMAGGVRKEYSLSVFIFNLVIAGIMEDILGCPLNIGIKLASGLFDLNNAVDILCLFECEEYVQRAPGGLSRAVARLGTCFASSKCSIVTRLENSSLDLHTRRTGTNHCWPLQLLRQLLDKGWYHGDRIECSYIQRLSGVRLVGVLVAPT